MDAKKREIRSIECQLAVREAGENAQGEQSRTIVGRAIVFNTESEVLDDWGMRFREVILPEACTKEWLRTQDVKMNLLHDRDMTLARCNRGAANSSLRLTVDRQGVSFEFEAPKCDIGDRALALVRSGVYSGCSFEFYPGQRGVDYEVEEREDKSVTITHRRFKAITALTIGMDPAYSSTAVNARELYDSTPKGKAEREAAEAATKAEEERKAREAQEQKEREEREKEEAMQREMNRRVEHLRRLSNFDEVLESTTF